MGSNSRTQLEQWVKEIKLGKGLSVLDIGGAQKPVAGRLGEAEQCNFTILDLPTPHEIIEAPAISCDIQSNAQINDVFNLPMGEYKHASGDMVQRWELKQFDVAFALEVSEYWLQPLEALKNINMLLKKGGLFYASFHFIYPVHKPRLLDYLRYTEFGVRKLLDEAGFKILEINGRKMTPEGLQAWEKYNGIEKNKSLDFL